MKEFKVTTYESGIIVDCQDFDNQKDAQNYAHSVVEGNVTVVTGDYGYKQIERINH